MEENSENSEQLVTLDQYLANVSLLTDADTESPEDNDKVTLMTVHSAKGLEFEVVYIGGMEENLFPSSMSISSMREIEEERRLFYVALTRAKRNVFLSFAASRYRYGSAVMSSPSRFIKEIDQRYLDMGGGASARHADNEPVARSIAPRFEPVTQRQLAASDTVRSSASAMSTADLSALRVGVTVEHDRFGRGTIVRLDAEGPNTRALVDFGAAGQKQLLVKFARLRVV